MVIPFWVLPVVKAVAIGIALVAAYQLVDNNWATDAGIAEGVKRQAVETKRVQNAYDEFVDKQQKLGDAQNLKTAQTNAANLKEKEKRDAALKDARDRNVVLDGELRRAREDRARSGFLPRAGAESKNPDRAQVNRAKFESAMGYLDDQGAGIAKAGDDYRVSLDSLKD